MAIIKQEVTENFFMLSNMIMMDGSLAINERGLLVTLYSLPKTWDFSIRGMTKILPNGERAITTALRKLESKRYVKCTYYRDKNGRFKTDIELFYHVKNAKNSGIFAETDNVENLDEDSAAIEEITVEEVEENATPEESHVNPIDDCKIEKTHENPVKKPKTFKEQLVAMIAKRNDENRTNTVTPCLKFSRKVRKNTEKFIKKDKMNKYNNNNNITDFVTAEEIENWRKIVKENIEYDSLAIDCKSGCIKSDVKQLDEIVEIMVEAVSSKRKSLRVCGENISQEVVKSRLLKLVFSDIKYVMTCLSENTTKIYNIKSYILTALYNAKSTHSNHTAAVFNHHELGNSKKTKTRSIQNIKILRNLPGYLTMRIRERILILTSLRKNLLLARNSTLTTDQCTSALKGGDKNGM